MKTEEQVRERLDTIMNTLRRTDVAKKGNENRIMALSAALRELDWVLDE